MTVLVTMIFCGGMPILLLFAALFFIVKYITDKIGLIYFYSKPPDHDESIARNVSNVLHNYALPLHLIGSILMYGVKDIFPRDIQIEEKKTTYQNSLISISGKEESFF